jgi:hypothetical protein
MDVRVLCHEPHQGGGKLDPGVEVRRTLPVGAAIRRIDVIIRVGRDSAPAAD